MNQQLQVIDLNAGALAVPAYLANVPTIVDNLAQGDTRNRIGLKGREFHIFKGGSEEGVLETKHADVVIVGAYPRISRQYYDKGYEEGVSSAPVCYSADGITPEANSSSIQSDKCQTCPQNVKGSALNGSEKSKACGFLRRIAVILSGDPEFTVFQLDIKSMSLWNDDGEAGINGKFSFSAYAKKLAAHHIDPGKVITRLTFDPRTGVPSLLFQAIGYIDQEQAARVVELVESGAVTPALEINVSSNASDETPVAVLTPPQQPPKPPAPRVAAPQPTPAPRVAPPAPKPAMQRPVAPRVTPVAHVPMPVQQDEDAMAAAHPAMQPTTIKYGQRRAPTAPLTTTKSAMRQTVAPKATPQEVQQDVDALIAELDG
jgi:hypothetical protein